MGAVQGVWRSGSGAEFKVWVFPATKGLEIENEVDVGVWDREWGWSAERLTPI